MPYLSVDKELYDDINHCEALITSEKLTTIIAETKAGKSVIKNHHTYYHKDGKTYKDEE